MSCAPASRAAVAGPAHQRAMYHFADPILLIRHQSVIEAQLLQQGFALEHFVTDRRSGSLSLSR